jgi:hypothetical protein
MGSSERSGVWTGRPDPPVGFPERLRLLGGSASEALAPGYTRFRGYRVVYDRGERSQLFTGQRA